MKRIFSALAIFLAISSATFAQDTSTIPRIERGILGTLVYSVLGILITLLVVKIVDWITPGKLLRQVSEEKNVALAIFAGSLILGICIIIASAIAS